MKPPRRVLMIQPYGMGDLLFLTPILRALRLVPSVEKVDLLLGSRTDAVICSNPHVDEIFSIDKGLFHERKGFQNVRELFALGRRLASNRYDLLIDFSLRQEYAFFGRFFLGIPRRAGFDYKGRGFFLTHKTSLPNGFYDRHVVDYFCDVAEAAGIRVEDRFLEFYVTDEDYESAKRTLPSLFASPQGGEGRGRGENWIVVAPGGGESWGKDAHFKRWPARFFAPLIQRLKTEFDFQHVLILGSRQEMDLGREVEEGLSLSSVNLMGSVSLGAAAVIIEKSKLFLGNDGGLMHLAHALRTPLIAFFGPVDPKVYGPYPESPEAIVLYKEHLECRPCYQKFRYHTGCIGRECLQAFLPEEAWRMLEKKMDFSAIRGGV